MSWHHLASCESTNDEAARLGRDGAPDGTVVVADEQRRGRGRQGRAWHSPAGEGLYLSVLLRPPLRPQEAPFLTLCAGVATADAIAWEIGDGDGDAVELKWPNDVLLRPAPGAQAIKVAGILTEMTCAGGELDFVVVGIGVNLNAEGFPEELAGRATSLRERLHRPVEPAPFAQGLVARLLGVLAAYYEQGTGPVLLRFAAHAAFLRRTQPLRVRSGRDLLHALPLGLCADGALLVRDGTGSTHRVVAGEIEADPAW